MTNALLLPYCMEYNRDVISERCASVASHMGLAERSFSGLLAWVLETRAALGVPHTLSEVCQLNASVIGELASVAKADAALGTNPKEADLDQLAQVLDYANTGRLRATA